jgi:hypothetical protein
LHASAQYEQALIPIPTWTGYAEFITAAKRMIGGAWMIWRAKIYATVEML